MTPTGFAYATVIPLHAAFYESYALKNMAVLEKAGTYKPYWIRVPARRSPLAGHLTYEEQVHCKPGSVLWGIRFCVYDSFWSPVATYATFRVSESYSGYSLFSENLYAYHFNPTVPPTYRIFLLPELFVLAPPADLDVEVCNMDSTSYPNWEMVLYLAEPYDCVEV
jgi:hypothetical protein